MANPYISLSLTLDVSRWIRYCDVGLGQLLPSRILWVLLFSDVAKDLSVCHHVPGRNHSHCAMVPFLPLRKVINNLMIIRLLALQVPTKLTLVVLLQGIMQLGLVFISWSLQAGSSRQCTPT